LDQRPIVLLATNVIGDSLTLGRQVFSDSMTDWLERTVLYFATRPDIQLVVRIHPGELITKGPSVADVVHKALPALPENIHLVPAGAKINTYDIVEIADLGLIYTTTVGMEMAMTGVPVVVVGNTHYRGKGFTKDPQSWEAYYEMLNELLTAPGLYRLSQTQVEQAWNYAYRFFFEYPHQFPWHLVHFWKDLETWPLSRLLGDEGISGYQQTFNYLVGEPIHW
jgi:capsule polysaccharide export protein KpsC/LpsZ